MQSLSNFTGSKDERGTCLCSVSLPDTTFPLERVERLELTAHVLSEKFEKELSKVSVFPLPELSAPEHTDGTEHAELRFPGG